MTEIWYTIYTRKNPPCSFCKDAIELLQVYGKNYYEIDLDEKGTRDFFKEKGFRTVPQIFREDQYIGGFNQLKEYLNDEQKQAEKVYRNRGNEEHS